MLENAALTAFAATEDPVASKAFYENVLGLEFVADEPTAMVFETENASLRISKVESVDPPDYTVLGWEVDDVKSVVATLADEGVEVKRYDELPQDDDGIMAFPDGTRVAWFEDPDGNTLSVTERADE